VAAASEKERAPQTTVRTGVHRAVPSATHLENSYMWRRVGAKELSVEESNLAGLIFVAVKILKHS
jgi:hypothetical protein